MEEWYEAERSGTVEETVQTITNILEEYAPLVDLVAKRMPADPDPRADVVFINRTGAFVSGLPHVFVVGAVEGTRAGSDDTFLSGRPRRASGLRFMACSMQSITTAPRSSEG